MRPIKAGLVAMTAGALLAACKGGGDAPAVDPGGSGTVGVAGGSVTMAGGPTIVIPAGALSADTTITVASSTIAAPGGAVTSVFQFGPDGTTFATPATVRFTVPAGTSAAEVGVYWTRPGSTTQWDILPVTVSGTTATVSVTHFSAGYVGAACPADSTCTPAGYATGPRAQRYVVTPVGSPPFNQSEEVVQAAAPNFTIRVDSNNGVSQTSHFIRSGGAVLYVATEFRMPNGAVTSYSYAPPLLIFPADTTPGATASSTSTVTSGASVYTTTRALTVDGVETVTVPAGTFLALKVTTIITSSNAPSVHNLAWWAPVVGRVKTINCQAAAPAVTTTWELTSSSPMICAGGTCACNDLVNSAPEVPLTFTPANLPAPAGGALADGAYSLTAQNLYTGPGGRSGDSLMRIKSTYVLQSGIGQWVYEDDGGAAATRSTEAVRVSGSQLISTTICGAEEPGDIGASRVIGFTASGDTLRLIWANPNYPASSSDQGEERVMIRR